MFACPVMAAVVVHHITARGHHDNCNTVKSRLSGPLDNGSNSMNNLYLPKAKCVQIMEWLYYRVPLNGVDSGIRLEGNPKF